jgi:class 3 adenylate cyclase
LTIRVRTPETAAKIAAGEQFPFADLGETVLRGFDEPVRLFEVTWREEG